VRPADTPGMRRPLILLTIGCLLLGAAPAQARYGVRPHQKPDLPNGILDTWAAAGSHVVGRSEIGVSPTLTLSMTPGAKRVIAWRVKNDFHAPRIWMRSTCDDGPRITFRYLTPTGQRVTGMATHGDGYSVAHVERGTFRTLYVSIRVKRSVDRTCALVGSGDRHAFDKVLLRVHA